MSKNFIKTSTELDAMRNSGKILSQILEILTKKAEPDMTPEMLADIAAKELKALGGEPVFLGYQGYPSVICISVNDQVQHSIPTKIPLAIGDVINFDFGVKYNGMITDAGTTIILGNVPNSNKDVTLLKGTKEALDKAIGIVKAGTRVGDVSATIEKVLTSYNLGIVKELVGHGVGHKLHEDPEIPNYGHSGTGPHFKAGMTVAIEPITTSGSPDIFIEKDGWTIKTWDGSNAAQFEHTVLILEDGCEILTMH